jgi:multiple sugar transport system permease protein
MASRQAKAGWRFLAPPLAVVAAVTLLPIAYAIYLSFSNVNLTLNGFQASWSGLHNYGIIFSSSLWWQSLRFTVGYAIATVIVETIIGMIMALILNAMVRGQGLALVMLLLPWSLITVVSAEMWSYMYNASYGILDYLLLALHLTRAPVNWLGSPALAMVAVGIADIWKTAPFVTLILLAGLKGIDPDLFEAARLDGAGSWAMLRRITLPLLTPSLLVAVLFRILQAFGLFDLPFVLTQGGPGTSTQSLVMLAYNAMFTNLEFGPGSGVAVLTVVCVLAVAVLFIRGLGVRLGGEDRRA